MHKNRHPAFWIGLAVLYVIFLSGSFGSISFILTKSFAESPLPKRKPLASASVCTKIRIADTGGEEVVAMNAVFSYVVEQLGYVPQTVLLKPQFVTYRMEHHGVDIFLAYWSGDVAMMKDNAYIHVFAQPSLNRATYSLAVPEYLFQQGLRSISDLPNFKDELQHTIFLWEESQFHFQVLQLLTEDASPLETFNIKTLASNETAPFLARMTDTQQPFVLLSWQPNSQNQRFRLRFLAQEPMAISSEEKEVIPFPSYDLYAIAKKSYIKDCSNITRFLQNLSFNATTLEQLMIRIVSSGKPMNLAVAQWLRTQPRFLAKILRDVKSLDGRHAFQAVLAALEKTDKASSL